MNTANIDWKSRKALDVNDLDELWKLLGDCAGAIIKAQCMTGIWYKKNTGEDYNPPRSDETFASESPFFNNRGISYVDVFGVKESTIAGRPGKGVKHGG
jgi:hypothetical protein